MHSAVSCGVVAILLYIDCYVERDHGRELLTCTLLRILIFSLSQWNARLHDLIFAKSK